MNILLLPGLLQYSDYLKLSSGISDEVKVVGVVINEKKKLPDWSPDRTKLRTWFFSDLIKVNDISTVEPATYEFVKEKVLSDSRTYFLLERLFGVGGDKSVLNHMIKLDQIIINSIIIIKSCKPDRIVTSNTPHSIMWFFCRISELLEVPVVFTQTSPLSWRIWGVVGIDEQRVLNMKGDASEADKERVHELIQKARGDYLGIMPAYELTRFKKYNGKFFKLRFELTKIFLSKSLPALMLNIYNSFKKFQALKQYQKLTSSFSFPEKYIVFFLHFQPERTTLPEGERFCQQWFALRAISENLPDGWKLVVKEHPSTFRNAFNPICREHSFYKNITQLKNTILAPLEMTPFNLIDHAQMSATVTGNVGLESLLRGKPVIFFGAAQFIHLYGGSRVKTFKEVRDIIKFWVNSKFDSAVLYSDLFEVLPRSFPKESRVNGSVEALRHIIRHPL